jgi:hypothetical protein
LFCHSYHASVTRLITPQSHLADLHSRFSNVSLTSPSILPHTSSRLRHTSLIDTSVTQLSPTCLELPRPHVAFITPKLRICQLTYLTPPSIFLACVTTPSGPVTPVTCQLFVTHGSVTPHSSFSHASDTPLQGLSLLSQASFSLRLATLTTQSCLSI